MTHAAALMEDDKFNRITVPIFSTKWAIVLCTCNFLVPGLGTCLAGLSLCCPCSDNPNFGCADCWCSAWLQFGVAALQLLLTPVCLLGWVWSCIWGCAFIGRSNPEWRASQERRAADAMLITEQPIGLRSGGGILSRMSFQRFADSRRSGGFAYGPLPPAYAEAPPPPYEEFEEPARANDEGVSGDYSTATGQLPR